MSILFLAIPKGNNQQPMTMMVTLQTQTLLPIVTMMNSIVEMIVMSLSLDLMKKMMKTHKFVQNQY
ncbi:hypothetical protein TSUD_150760 [Trifolium subterraneum]|uniref:Uncharacterized protein n=1 Tax=Trifolium subterraneum TaxID=3900 RepID=A0A2Z6N7E7_TRISU|nr:hypothetical protein TSUD_150760 [Trifolium subterraneum]